ncbi:MAG: argininosuccinate lyase [Coriobacteriia bacterium]|nr:argininosuccinate lyase [Coriobacteriia bacterium]
MPALQVRELPQTLYDDLQRRAAREHRSMAQQTIVALEEHLRRDAFRVAPVNCAPEWSDGDERERQERAARKRELIERIRARAAMAGGAQGEATDIAQLVRDMREERTNHQLEVLQGGAQEGESR